VEVAGGAARLSAGAKRQERRKQAKEWGVGFMRMLRKKTDDWAW